MLPDVVEGARVLLSSSRVSVLAVSALPDEGVVIMIDGVVGDGVVGVVTVVEGVAVVGAAVDASVESTS